MSGEERMQEKNGHSERVGEFFREAPARLTHGFSHRGPMSVVASSGLTHTKETD